MIKKSAAASKRDVRNGVAKVEIEWELRPGGMLVQRRNLGNASSSSSSSSSPGAMIKIKVSNGSFHHDISVPAHSTFGELKEILKNESGLEPKEQRLLFQGKEKDDAECLDMVGVQDMSKIVLLEDPASKERKVEEMQRNQTILKAYESVVLVRADVDKLFEKVVSLERVVNGGTKVKEEEFAVLSELLMAQLLKLDSIEAEGEAKVQRKVEVHRVQGIVDTIDTLRARNSSPFTNSSSAVSITKKWEPFATDIGSLRTMIPLGSSTRITQEWVVFD